MLLADSNIWLAQAITQHEFHAVVSKWWSRIPHSVEVAFCRSTQQSLLRLLTTHSIFSRYNLPPMNNASAWALYSQFRSDVRVRFLEEPIGTEAEWRRITDRAMTTPKLWMDAYLAGFAVAGRHRLLTTDEGFRQFAGLDVEIILP